MNLCNKIVSVKPPRLCEVLPYEILVHRQNDGLSVDKVIKFMYYADLPLKEEQSHTKGLLRKRTCDLPF